MLVEHSKTDPDGPKILYIREDRILVHQSAVYIRSPRQSASRVTTGAAAGGAGGGAPCLGGPGVVPRAK
ncbi:hypothetical protein GCM10029978_008030 [Actinoallomurus acanthiterrae]